MATPRPALSPETAPETLQEFWLFPVAPEVCNLACTHCLYAASPQRKNSYRLTEDELADLFEELEDLGVTPNLMFTGGEPTLHPQLYDFFAQAERQGYTFQIHTNGTRIHADEATRLAKFPHLKKVQISLEGPTPELHDQVMGHGLYQRTLRAIDELRSRNVPVTIAVTPMESNQERFAEIEQLAAQRGAEVVRILLYDLGAATTNSLKPATTIPPQRGKDMTLMCDKGIAYSEGKYFPCPVLVKDPEAMLGTSVREALGPTAREQVRQLKSRKEACAVCLRGST
jgi:MoaA/NifB/PqqE/SkfB family radical SAM enzyme